MNNVQVIVADPGRYVDDAARIWAEGTRARDDGTEIPSLDVARPVIAAVLERSPRSALLVAMGGNQQMLGFAAIAPAGPDRPETAEVRYLGVAPSHWGSGVATALLKALPARLLAGGFASAWLSVYVENARAVELYERLGWRRRGAPAPHPASGRLQQGYELALSRSDPWGVP